MCYSTSVTWWEYFYKNALLMMPFTWHTKSTWLDRQLCVGCFPVTQLWQSVMVTFHMKPNSWHLKTVVLVVGGCRWFEFQSGSVSSWFREFELISVCFSFLQNDIHKSLHLGVSLNFFFFPERKILRVLFNCGIWWTFQIPLYFCGVQELKQKISNMVKHTDNRWVISSPQQTLF